MVVPQFRIFKLVNSFFFNTNAGGVFLRWITKKVIAPQNFSGVYALEMGVGGLAVEFLEINPKKILGLAEINVDDFGFYLVKEELLRKVNGEIAGELEFCVGRKIYLDCE